MAGRLQLNLRLDGYGDLLQEAKEKAQTEGKSLSQWVIDQIKLGVGRPLDQLDPALDKAVERLDRYLDGWLQNQIDDKIEEIVETKLILLLDSKLSEALDKRISIELQSSLNTNFCHIEKALAIDQVERLEKLNKDVNSKLDTMLDTKLASLADNLRSLEESTESLNNLCKFSFETAFKRIGRLERSEQVNDLGLNEPASEIPDAQVKIDRARLLAADIKLTQAELAVRLGVSERSMRRWKAKSEEEFTDWLEQHEPAGNLVWKLIPGTLLFRPELKELPLENGFGDPGDPSLDYRYNAAIKAIEELGK